MTSAVFMMPWAAILILIVHGSVFTQGVLPKGVILTPIPEAMNSPRWTGKKWVDSNPSKRFIFWKTKG